MRYDLLIRGLEKAKEHYEMEVRWLIAQAADGDDRTSAGVLATVARQKKSRGPYKKKAAKKSFSYKGKHWTQKPENAGRLKKMLKKAAKNRHGKS